MDIHHGLATVFSETSEQFIPQMLNMDLTNAVSFDKGCYPGQEIVARMHYLGKLKTRMVLGSIDAPSPPTPGDKVYAVAHEQSIGVVVDTTPGNDGYDQDCQFITPWLVRWMCTVSRPPIRSDLAH